jgi:hypothetical protein
MESTENNRAGEQKIQRTSSILAISSPVSLGQSTVALRDTQNFWRE